MSRRGTLLESHGYSHKLCLNLYKMPFQFFVFCFFLHMPTRNKIEISWVSWLFIRRKVCRMDLKINRILLLCVLLNASKKAICGFFDREKSHAVSHSHYFCNSAVKVSFCCCFYQLEFRHHLLILILAGGQSWNPNNFLNVAWVSWKVAFWAASCQCDEFL